MTKKKKYAEIRKQKIAGEIKKAAGKISGNEQLELKGRLQSSRADLKKKTSLYYIFDRIKESLAGKMNKALKK